MAGVGGFEAQHLDGRLAAVPEAARGAFTALSTSCRAPGLPAFLLINMFEKKVGRDLLFLFSFWVWGPGKQKMLEIQQCPSPPIVPIPAPPPPPCPAVSSYRRGFHVTAKCSGRTLFASLFQQVRSKVGIFEMRGGHWNMGWVIPRSHCLFC